MKCIYKTSTLELAEKALVELEDKWNDKYGIVVRSWKNNWENLNSYFKYSPAIRKMIYTTNIIEGFNRQLRKVTKNRSVFPNDPSLKKLLYLATKNASKKWTMPRHGWGEIISQFSIHFEDRIELGL